MLLFSRVFLWKPRTGDSPLPPLKRDGARRSIVSRAMRESSQILSPCFLFLSATFRGTAKAPTLAYSRAGIQELIATRLSSVLCPLEKLAARLGYETTEWREFSLHPFLFFFLTSSYSSSWLPLFHPACVSFHSPPSRFLQDVVLYNRYSGSLTFAPQSPLKAWWETFGSLSSIPSINYELGNARSHPQSFPENFIACVIELYLGYSRGIALKLYLLTDANICCYSRTELKVSTTCKTFITEKKFQ